MPLLDTDGGNYRCPHCGAIECDIHLDQRPMGKPVLELSGTDGNAFTILGKARRAALANGMDWPAIEAEAKAGNYDHLLQTIMRHFDVE